ncbi:scaffold/adaptor protein [Lithospermum erythrorhizon]|uniref:Scaffold/adaptor protein n=1 Tax=Lithospermum erythrorhizon TaxID=34254 RepID=A0AAV3Q5I7_LITER
MEAIRKQATKLREQVAKQQAVFKQFAGGAENAGTNEGEMKHHKKLEKLYTSTRTAKHFQRDIVRGVEGYIATVSKQVEIGTKLSEDSRKYGAESTCTGSSKLAKIALSFSRACGQIETERENLLKALGTQVAEPLRSMVVGASLEEARHLTQRYDRVRQDAEAQAIEVSRRQVKVRESNGNPDALAKLGAAEAKLQDLKSNMDRLGREAVASMTAVEGHQQRLTLQRLVAMVEAERSYHIRVLQILDQLEEEMLSERQQIEASPILAEDRAMSPPSSYNEGHGESTSESHDLSTDGMGYFLGEVLHPYQAESDVELTLSVGDYVVVRKVLNNGWAEGECKGLAGWFPHGCIERRERVLASKVAEVF